MKKIDYKKIYILIKEFLINLFEPKVSFYAASMSWSTLFFIIPLLVIIFSILLHLPIFNEYYDKIHSLIASYIVPTNSKDIMKWIDSFVNNAHTMGYVGGVYVVIAAFLFFRDYDFIVNDIFNLPRRSFLNATILYFLLLLIVPIVMALIIWFTSSEITILKFFSQFIIVWSLIFLIFMITPKEKIPFKIVALSSFVTSFVWVVAKSLFIFYITYNKTYTTIYGAVSIVLFIFLWIYLSWVIFLHGLQLTKILLDEEKDE